MGLNRLSVEGTRVEDYDRGSERGRAVRAAKTKLREAWVTLFRSVNGDIVEASNIAADAMNEAAETCRVAGEIDGTPGSYAGDGDGWPVDAIDEADPMFPRW
jgi:hypothetical protein